MANKDNPTTGRKFENIAQLFFQTQGLVLNKPFKIKIGFPGREKEHAFDLGSDNPKILVECKAHTWTRGKNVPSAKISVWNEAMFFFNLAPAEYRKIFFVLRSDRNGQSLAKYYISRFQHLIPDDVEIWEYDPHKNSAYQMNI